MHEQTIWIHPINGNVCITGFSWDNPSRPEGLTDREFVATLMLKLAKQEGFDTVPEYRIAPEGEPGLNNLYFRDAWTDIDLSVDMEKARAIHLANIRTVRDAELAKLDIPFMQAMESSDQGAIKQISTRKQYLRDIPADLDLTTDITTASHLQAKWPTGLAKAISQE